MRRIKNYFILLTILLSGNSYSEIWEPLASQDKGIGKTVYSSKKIIVEVPEGRITLINSYPMKCDSDYGIKYGVMSLNNNNIKLEFTCSEGRYPKEKYKIATKEGMLFTFNFLKAHDNFTFQITTPTVERGIEKVHFDRSLADVIKEPRITQLLNQTTQGTWYGVSDKEGQYIFIEDRKSPRSNLLNLRFDKIKSEVTVQIKLNEANWRTINGHFIGGIGECNYLESKKNKGVLYINNNPISFSLECEYRNTISSMLMLEGDISYVPSVGRYSVSEFTLDANAIKNLAEIKNMEIRFELESLLKDDFSKKITLTRSLSELIKLLEEQNNKKHKAIKDKKNAISEKVNDSM